MGAKPRVVLCHVPISPEAIRVSKRLEVDEPALNF